MSSFQSVFREPLAAYVQLRRGLGYRFNEEGLLRAFDRYLSESGSSELTQELALEFATTTPTARRGIASLATRSYASSPAIYPSLTPKPPGSTRRLCPSAKLALGPIFTRTRKSNVFCTRPISSRRRTRCVE